MDLKVQVDDDGTAYVAAIDPDTGEHRKSATVGHGQELEIGIPDATSVDDVEFSEVKAIGEPPPATEAPAETEQPGGGNEGSAVNTSDQGATPPAGDGEQPPADQGSEGATSGEPASTSAASEKPLYLVDGDELPDGFEASGLETPDGKTLYHFGNDTAGQSATGNVDGVSVYADADDNEQPVQAAQPAAEPPA